MSFSTFSLRGQLFDELWHQVEGRPVAELKAREGEKNPLLRLIRSEGLKREFPLIVATLKAFSEGRVRVEEGEVLSATGEAIGGSDLTQEINEAVIRRA